MKACVKIPYLLLLLAFCVQSSGFAQKLSNNNAYIKSESGSYWIFANDASLKIDAQQTDQTQFNNVKVDFDGNGVHKLVLNKDSYLTVTGDLSLSDSLLIKADQNDQASLLLSGSVSGSMAKVQQYLQADRWHLISSPVSDETINTYYDIYLKQWIEPDDDWTYLITPLSIPLKAGAGYSAWASSNYTDATTVELDGTLNTSDIDTTLSYTPASEKAGWHLLGNPYTCGLEWNSSWTKTNVDATVYTYDGAQYNMWNYNDLGQNTMPNGIIPPTQGFWVKANNTGAGITIPKNERLHSAQSFYKSDPDNLLLKLKVSGNGYDDYLSILEVKYATVGFDSEWDAYKLRGIAAAPQLYASIPGTEVSVNALPDITTETTIDTEFECGEEGLYTLSIEKYVVGIDYLPVFLLDKKEELLLDLTLNKHYSFFASQEDDPERFEIIFGHFSNEGHMLYGDNFNKANVYGYDHKIFVDNHEDQNLDIRVFDILGHTLIKSQIEARQQKAFSLEEKSSCYFVQLSSNSQTKIHKILIP